MFRALRNLSRGFITISIFYNAALLDKLTSKNMRELEIDDQSIFLLFSARPRNDRVTGGNTPAVMTHEYLSLKSRHGFTGNGQLNGTRIVDKNARTFKFGLKTSLTADLRGATNDPVSNFHSEPALNRKSVHFANRSSDEGDAGTAVATHSSGDLRKGAKTSRKSPNLLPFSKKKNSDNTSSDSAEVYQNGVLRISAPFLNNPMVQHIN